MFARIRDEIKKNGEHRFGKYGSFWRRFAIGRWTWGASLCHFDEHWSLHLFCIWVTLCRSKTAPVGEILDSWGFHFDFRDRYLSLNWRDAVKFFYFPWAFDHCRTEIMLSDGTFIPMPKYEWDEVNQRRVEPEGVFRFSAPYVARCKSGALQDDIVAEVTVERRSWCWRAWPFRIIRWPRRVRVSIDVKFDKEAGDMRGSWKGGAIGVGYDLRRGETPQDCLKRMERDRVFR